MTEDQIAQLIAERDSARAEAKAFHVAVKKALDVMEDIPTGDMRAIYADEIERGIQLLIAALQPGASHDE